MNTLSTPNADSYTIIKPTVGQPVWYWPSQFTAVNVLAPAQPIAATIVFVHGDALVNIAGNDHAGYPFHRQMIMLRQGETPAPVGEPGYCEWTPATLRAAKP